MSSTDTRRRLALVFGAFLASRPALATEFFVSPTGSDHGNGSQKAPWSLAKALSHPEAVHPGDTIWLRGGAYMGTFTSYLKGTANQPIMVRQYPGERATLDGNVNSSRSGSNAPVLSVENGGYTWYWGFEVTNSSPVRTDTAPCTYCRGDGLYVNAPGTKVINCVIHDAGQGITSFQYAVNSEIYGNLVYYNGWNAPDRGHGHGIYVNNFTGSSKLIKHNILFDGVGYNLHAYGSAASMFVNSLVEENVWWRGPALVGGKNGFDIGGTSVTRNFSWSAPLTIGYWTTKCANVTVSGNYLADLGGGVFAPGSTDCRAGETITANTFVGDLSGFRQTDYPSNTYYSKTSLPTQDKVTVLPNAYELGRATIVINNWDGRATQVVDLTGVVSPGAAYEIRNAQNFYGPPVVSGAYAGGSVTLPMTGLMPASPVGYVAPPPTGPRFNVFIVLPLTRRWP